jgi:beta-lactamase regulating signal transducer with metallopeptidase domain
MSPTREILFDLLFNALLQIALFAIVAATLSRLIAKAKAKYQYFFYLFVLLLSLVAPVVNTLWHRHSAGIAEDSEPQALSRGAGTNYGAWILRRSSEQHESFLIPPGFQSLMIDAWAVLVLLRLARFCRAVRRVHHLKREALVLSFADVGVASQIIESSHRVALLKSPAIDDPVTVGVFHPAIVLPSKLLPCLANQELSAILAHEYGHIRRSDFLFHVVCELISLPVAWHPGTGYLLSKISQTRELACDDYAATRLGKRRSYANTLLRLASLSLHVPRGNAVAMGFFDGDNLETRISVLTEKRAPLSRAGLIGLFLATSIAFGAGAILAHAMSLQTSSDPSTTTERFAGTWHWMFDGKSFATMTLVRSGSNFSGSVTQSRIALKRDGSLLRADPSDDPSPKQITGATLEGSSMHVTLADGFQFNVINKDDTHAEIHPVGAPPNMKPILAEKVR